MKNVVKKHRDEEANNKKIKQSLIWSRININYTAK